MQNTRESEVAAILRDTKGKQLQQLIKQHATAWPFNHPGVVSQYIAYVIACVNVHTHTHRLRKFSVT